MSVCAKVFVPSTGPTRRQVIANSAAVVGGLLLVSSTSLAQSGEEISHAAESIHQEPLIHASRQRVYDALTDTKQFDKITDLSGVRKSLPPDANKPTQISYEEGGAFTIFGGYITGRQIELVPGARIVQAWRVGSWPSGLYSIVRLDLVEQGTATKIVFDHTGFPNGAADHLASGWKAHYWEPLAKLLA